MIASEKYSTTTEISALALTAESTLQELTLYKDEIIVDQPGGKLAEIFEENPVIPGVILRDDDSFFGMVSRRRFLEILSRQYGPELFLKRPLRLLYEYAKTEVLILDGNLKIVDALQPFLQRSPELLYEPIVVQLEAKTYQLLDVHHLLLAHSKIHEFTTSLLHEQTQAKLIQTEKMASLGEMVAGVAHEILNPVNFISGNLEYLSNYSQDLICILNAYLNEFPEPSQHLNNLKEEVELDFLLTDLPQLISSIKLGSERLKKIIAALRNFSHMDEVNKRPVDLHECLDNTLLILNARIKNSISVIKRYGDLPLIHAYSGQLSQVFTNLIGNAIDALIEVEASPSTTSWKPQIDIKTNVVSESSTDGQVTGNAQKWATVSITDNGPGIPAEVQTKIFDTFFTTKPVGKGTGLGLAISKQIVVEKHGGQLNVRSQPGQGTTFEVLLPIF